MQVLLPSFNLNIHTAQTKTKRVIYTRKVKNRSPTSDEPLFKIHSVEYTQY